MLLNKLLLPVSIIVLLLSLTPPTPTLTQSLLGGAVGFGLFLGMAILQRGAMGVFGLFILAALFANLGTFEWGAIELIVLTGTHLGLGLLVGWGAARIAGCATADRRSVMFETGIQNSGLALVIAFAFFGGASGTVLVPALWGLWQAWLGGALALVLRRL